MKNILTKLSLNEIQKEIKRRERRAAALQRKRAAILKKLAAVETAISAEGGKINAKAGRLTTGGVRPRNKAPLPDTMVRVMSTTKAMSVAEIESAVLKAGYKTVSSTFRTIIFQTLARDNRFKKKARGQYLLA